VRFDRLDFLTSPLKRGDNINKSRINIKYITQILNAGHYPYPYLTSQYRIITLPCFLNILFARQISTWNAQRIWTTAKNISFSAKCIPGQIRLLCNLCNQNLNAINIHLPSAECTMITFPWILRVHRFRRRNIVLTISLGLKYHVRAISRIPNQQLTRNEYGSGYF